jgi:hypothetical protein
MQEKNDKKSTILSGHFDGRGGAPVQYHAHHPIEGIQGYNGSHWLMPPGAFCRQLEATRQKNAVFFSFFIVDPLKWGPR